MNQMYVNDEVRGDLATAAKVTQSDLRGYAFSKIFPLITVSEKGGTMAVAPKTLTNAAGQASRSDGSSITTDDLANVSVSYTCGRVEGRGRIYEHEMHGFTDMNAACAAGATVAGRRVLNKIEALAAAQVFTSVRTTAKTTLTDHEVVKKLQQSAKAVRAFGKPFLYCSDAAFLKFCDIPEIRRRLELGMRSTGDVGYLALQDEKVCQTISTLLGFYGVAIFDSDIVGSTYDNYVAVVAVRLETLGAGSDAVKAEIKSRAAFGATFMYIPQGAPADEPFVVSTAADRPNKANLFDAEGWLVSKNFVAAVATAGDTSTMSENGGAVVCQFASSYTEYAVPVVNVTTGS